LPEDLTVWVLDPIEPSREPVDEWDWLGSYVFIVQELLDLKAPHSVFSGISALRLVAEKIAVAENVDMRDLAGTEDVFGRWHEGHPIEKIKAIGAKVGRRRRIETVYKIGYMSDEQYIKVNGAEGRINDILAYPLYIAELRFPVTSPSEASYAPVRARQFDGKLRPADLRSEDGPLSVRVRPSSLKRDCPRRTTSTGGKVPGKRTREVALDPGDLCRHSGQRPRAKPKPARTGRGPSPARCRRQLGGRTRKDKRRVRCPRHPSHLLDRISRKHVDRADLAPSGL
jgi:hypothetical protein